MSTRKITVVAVLAVLFLVGVVTENNVLAKESELRPGLRKTTVEENKIVLEYEFERPKHRKKDGADLFEIEGLRLHERAGVPIIPVRHVRVLVPFGKKV